MGSSKGSQEQEQAIKARKQLLFEAEDVAKVGGDRTPFADYVRTTPAAPLPLWIKAALGAAGAVAGLFLIAALVRGGRERVPPRPNSGDRTAESPSSSGSAAKPVRNAKPASKP